MSSIIVTVLKEKLVVHRKCLENTSINISVILLYLNCICKWNNDIDQVPCCSIQHAVPFVYLWINKRFSGEMEDGKLEISISPAYRTTKQYFIKVI